MEPENRRHLSSAGTLRVLSDVWTSLERSPMNIRDALGFLVRATITGSAPIGHPGDITDDDLFAAAGLTLRVRELNSAAGGAVLSELTRRGYSLRQIEDRTGIPKSTIHAWATPPPRAGQQNLVI
jgi:hypothetical protein